jgi:predicted aspartyl protease
MAQGYLNSANAPLIPIELAGQPLMAVIDTGFEGGLQLPATLFTSLNPVPYRQVKYELGGGQEMIGITFWVKFTLDGVESTAEALFAASDQLLIGLDALKDCRLEINFAAGSVLLERVTP